MDFDDTPDEVAWRATVDRLLLGDDLSAYDEVARLALAGAEVAR